MSDLITSLVLLYIECIIFLKDSKIVKDFRGFKITIHKILNKI
jgi:hypothetical protein